MINLNELKQILVLTESRNCQKLDDSIFKDCYINQIAIKDCYLKRGECFCIDDSKNYVLSEIVEYYQGSFFTCSRETEKKFVMSWGFSGCMFIIEKTLNNKLIAYHLSLDGIGSDANKKSMANYIEKKSTSSFWGITPTLIINPQREDEKMWIGRDKHWYSSDISYKTVIALSDNVGNMYVIKALYKEYPPRIFYVKEIYEVEKNLVMKTEPLKQYLRK